MRQWLKRMSLVAAFILIPAAAIAQAPATPSAQSGAVEPQLLKPQELDALVAPIALYPDTLLSLVLMGATYPLEVVQAERWLVASKLKGDQLKAAIDKQAWDHSIKSLAATPEVLTMMSTQLDWTQKLGDTVLAQQSDVLDAVQRLRARAQANEKLKSTKEQTVAVKREQDKQVIVIEQTDPNTVHVPYYDPAVAYGAWPYADYPPSYFPAPGYIAGGLIATGLAFGTGYALGRWATGGRWWGGGCNWGDNNLVNRPGNIGGNWQHRPEHRHGVRYSNANVQQRFSTNDLRARTGERAEFRGRDDRQADRGERQGDRQAERGDRQADRQADRGDRQADRGSRQGERQADRTGRQGDRAAAKGDRVAAKGGNRAGAGGPKAAARPAAGAREGAFSMQSGSMARMQSARGQASLGGGRVGMGTGGGPRGGGGFRGGGGGRRSDARLKHDIVLLRHLDNGLGLYRFRYGGNPQTYVGVIAQEAMKVAPEAVVRGRDGYFRVRYAKLGLRFRTYDRWLNVNDATGIR